jgi:hypothetical protein
MNPFLNRFILFISSICFSGWLIAQCPGGVRWKNGLPAGGTLRDTGIVLVNDTVYIRTTTPTLGSFASGRPGYLTNSTSWSGYTFQAIGLYRGGGFGATTRFVFKQALDSNHIHFRISDVRGDGFNTEYQTILGFRNGVPVAATFKDPVNGVVIVGGNEVRGASTTTGPVQSATRVFFNQAVDSVIISSTGLSDYVILELFARCDVVLASDAMRIQAMRINEGVLLSWSNADTDARTNGAGFYIQRCGDGINWIDIGYSPSTRFTDAAPLNGLNYYRVKWNDRSGQTTYSVITTIEAVARENAGLLSIYPNPFNDYIRISGLPKGKATIYNALGKQAAASVYFSFNTPNALINTRHLPAGIYFVTLVNAGGKIISKSIIKN